LAVTKLESCELPHILTEPFILHRIRARLLQAYFTSAASEMYVTLRFTAFLPHVV
jgi:hypothetical protein